MKHRILRVILLVLGTLTSLTSDLPAVSAQILYPPSQFLQARKAQLIVIGEVLDVGQLSFSFDTHAGSRHQTVVFRRGEALKGSESGEYIRMAVITEKRVEPARFR